MQKVDLNEFSFTRSFVFLRQNKRVKSKEIRRQLKEIKFRAGLENSAPIIVRHRVSLGTLPPTYGSVSLLLGETVRSPTFANGTLHERVLAYVLLIESEGYAAMQLRHLGTTDIEPLFNSYALVPYAQITSVLTNGANILKIVSKIINPAQSGLTGRAYEGNSLQNEMPQFGSGKTIPRSLKANDNGAMISVTASASRITTYGQAVNIDQVGKWFYQIRTLLEQNRRSTFLSRFAEPVDFATAIPNLAPSLVVFDALGLQHKIAQEGLVWRRKFRKQGERKLTRPVATSQMADYIVAQLSRNAIIKKNEFSFGKIDIGSSKIKVDLSAFRNFTLFDGKKDLALSTFVNSRELFSIYFDSPDHVYMSGAIYRDSGIVGEAQSVIAAIEGVDALARADREKIDLSRDVPHPDKINLDRFPDTSVFAIAEEAYQHALFIFCDDLGDEWADHIAVDSDNKTLSFIHSKHGELTTGASSLHEVVGQALKNMGNLLCLPSAMGRKIARYNRTYHGTQIPLVRRAPAGATAVQIEESVVQILSDNLLRREAVLCCSFLSAGEVIAQLTKLKDGQKVRPHIRQLLWLLSYFVAACKELSVVPRILCRK
ncbi:hypothetical protein GJ700_20340 [Duganella sp. FT92W]|uniref:Uncharacterized protein n=1 Tax=Pseudoduganella rivuli TaxID=2666085 RepID=A0A7X2IQR8_9BURK|nr:hypothetical protein [Pseudoduganella rivuli]MRV74062.1 hypothetical protein [Pseudoduganella rivuli]